MLCVAELYQCLCVLVQNRLSRSVRLPRYESVLILHLVIVVMRPQRKGVRAKEIPSIPFKAMLHQGGFGVVVKILWLFQPKSGDTHVHPRVLVLIERLDGHGLPLLGIGLAVVFVFFQG